LPAIGYDGQARIAAATVAVAGDDLTAEVVARALGAAGVGTLRWLRRSELAAPVASALAGSNPDLRVELPSWPSGPGWVEALRGSALVVRSGFDDDVMLRAAIRLGLPAIVVRAQEAQIDLLSFRRHGPCPHLALDLPEVPAAPNDGGPAAVVAGHAAAAEALLILAGATADDGRARHLRLPLDGGPPRTADLPWTPECFACGGVGTEMTFA